MPIHLVEVVLRARDHRVALGRAGSVDLPNLERQRRVVNILFGLLLEQLKAAASGVQLLKPLVTQNIAEQMSEPFGNKKARDIWR